MLCPNCSHQEDKVLDSRVVRDGRAIRRRRECQKCRTRFTTYETIEATIFQVIKKDGRREAYDRKKLIKSLEIACRKRPVSVNDIEQAVDDIEEEAFMRGGNEIASRLLGDLVLKRLRNLDKVAYVRFASVYRSFDDPKEFIIELKLLAEEENR
jgi:transcriptional repressor NrdR